MMLSEPASLDSSTLVSLEQPLGSTHPKPRAQERAETPQHTLSLINAARGR